MRVGASSRRHDPGGRGPEGGSRQDTGKKLSLQLVISCCLSAAFSASSQLLGLKSDAQVQKEEYERDHRGRR